MDPKLQSPLPPLRQLADQPSDTLPTPPSPDLAPSDNMLRQHRFRIPPVFRTYKRQVIGLASTAILLGGLASAIFLSQNSQDVRQQASSGTGTESNVANFRSSPNPTFTPAQPSSIAEWESCIAMSGSRVLQTYPSICVSPTGQRVTQPTTTTPSTPEPTPSPTATPVPTPEVPTQNDEAVNYRDNPSTPTPTPPQPPLPVSWDECINQSGSKVLQVYPAICTYPDGRKATQPITATPTPTSTPTLSVTPSTPDPISNTPSSTPTPPLIPSIINGVIEYVRSLFSW